MHNSLILMLLAAPLMAEPPRPIEQPKDPYALALDLARGARDSANPGLYDRAEEALRQAAPGSFEARRIRAWILLGRHEFAQALELAQQLSREMPDDPMVYGLLTDAYVELGRYAEAEASAQWMLDLGRGSIPALTRAAYLRELHGDVAGALELMQTALSRGDRLQSGDRAWMLTQTGHLLRLLGRRADAERVLNAALGLAPEYHYALAALARVREDQGRHTAAVRLLRRRYQAAPHPENLFELAAALHRAGQRRAARELFLRFERQALRESNSWDNANRELVEYYADYARRPKDALRIAELEVARRRDVHTLDAHAWALYRCGRHREARQQMRAALAAGTREPRILGHARAMRLNVARS